MRVLGDPGSWMKDTRTRHVFAAQQLDDTIWWFCATRDYWSHAAMVAWEGIRLPISIGYDVAVDEVVEDVVKRWEALRTGEVRPAADISFHEASALERQPPAGFASHNRVYDVVYPVSGSPAKSAHALCLDPPQWNPMPLL